MEMSSEILPKTTLAQAGEQCLYWTYYLLSSWKHELSPCTSIITSNHSYCYYTIECIGIKNYAEQLLSCTAALPAWKPKVKESLNSLPPALLSAVLNFILHTRLGHKAKQEKKIRLPCWFLALNILRCLSATSGGLVWTEDRTKHAGYVVRDV